MLTSEPSLPRPFGKYTLLRSLGQGGTAEIFLAREPQTAEPLVIKRLLPELSDQPQFLAMLVSEAKVAALLNHPAIVRIHELGKEEGLVYLAMEYVPGWDLESLAEAAGGWLPPAIAARIGLAVAEALSYAHHATDLEGRPLGLVHRDVTPTNVLITAAGQVKLIDFGVAKAAVQLIFTQPGFVKGKFRFMSPEQIEQKQLDGRSDLFSLGVTLYETTVGVQPFDRKHAVDILTAVLRYQPPLPSSVVDGFPPRLEEIIIRAMDKDRTRRFADARAMAAALREVIPLLDGPSDLASYVRELARAHPDKLPPPHRRQDGGPEPTEVIQLPRHELQIINLPETPEAPELGPSDSVQVEPMLVTPTPKVQAAPALTPVSGPVAMPDAQPIPEPPRATQPPRSPVSRKRAKRARLAARRRRIVWTAVTFVLLAAAAAAGTWFALQHLMPRPQALPAAPVSATVR